MYELLYHRSLSVLKLNKSNQTGRCSNFYLFQSTTFFLADITFHRSRSGSGFLFST